MLEQLIAFLSQCFALRDVEYSQIRAQLPILLRDQASEARAMALRSEPINPIAMVGDVAVIDVTGVLTKYPGIMRLFGLDDRATLPEIEQAVMSAATDSKVRGVILRFDTPGGTVAGTEAAGLAIARCAGVKPTIALVSDLCCSAGYWLASQCDRIVTNATADVGSIGAMAGFYDYSGMLDELGVKAIVARSTPLKGIGGLMGDKITAEQQAELDRWIASKHDLFVSAVAKGRGVSEADARKWATAQVWSGAEALRLGLVDGIGGFDEAMKALDSAGTPGVGGSASARMEHVADGRPKHGEQTMGPKLKAYLVTLGLAASASESAALDFYKGLTGEQRTKADAINLTEQHDAGQVSGQAQGGGQQNASQAGGSQQATPSASQQAPNPPNGGGSDGGFANPQAAQRAGMDRGAIQELAAMAGMDGEDRDSFVTRHFIGQTSEREVRQELVGFMQQSRPPIGTSRTTAGDDGRESFAAALGDVMTMRLGGVIEKPHGRVAEIEHLRPIEIGRRMLAQIGVPNAGSMPEQEVAMCMINKMHMAGYVGSVALSHGTSDFSGVLGASANKSLADAFDSEPTTYQAWARNDVLPNTLIHTEYASSGIPQPPMVTEGQEFGLATISEKGETKQVAKYGLRTVLTIEMIINDTLSFFSERLLDFGGAARQLRNYLVYNKLANPGNSAEDNTAFFAAGHNNLNEGGAAALAEGPLSLMKSAMRLQEGPDPGNGGIKRKLAIMPSFLLVPEELSDTAERLVASVVKVGGTNAEPNLQFLRRLQPISDPELSADSATAYYLTGPKRKSPVKSLTLRGYERPSVLRQNLSRTDGIEFILRDFAGAAAVEYRSAQKNAGT